MALVKVDVNELTVNPFAMFGKQWALVSAGTPDKWNTMTIGWGALGVIWGKPTATCYVRYSRYTKEFMDGNDEFTITFLKDGNREALNRLGSQSGRDIDKMHDSGLTPVLLDGQPAFEEAELVLVCRKRGQSEIAPNDMNPEVCDRWYADKDYHVMYLGEITAVYQQA